MAKHGSSGSSGSGRSSGKSGGGPAKAVPMTPQAASRVQSAAARNGGSNSAQSGFAPRAQSAAARNTN
jgi:hypothetical protein